MSKTVTDLTLQELIEHCQHRLETVFVGSLYNIPSLELKVAMEYVLKNGGKHLRPLLIYATGAIFQAPWENMDIPAAAVEMIHTYSLIHDDLPCMDNADLRRGKPACHKAFTEGMAVLTGDALQTLAMQLITSHTAPLKPEKRLLMIKVLSEASGPFGMAAGQALDISMLSDESLSTGLLETIYRLKTGALFSACIELGWLASNNDDAKNQRALKQFGDCVGLAFQIQDDILDVEASSDVSGKPQGIDEQNNKLTYVKRYGMTAAKEKVEALYQEALESINYLGAQARLLRELTGYMLQRR